MRIKPGSPEWHERKALLLAEERGNPATWWWLSFANPKAERGKQFLGAAIVRAPGVVSATQRAWDLGINPGGEVMSWQIPEGAQIPHGVTDRLLSRRDIDERLGGAVIVAREEAAGAD